MSLSYLADVVKNRGECALLYARITQLEVSDLCCPGPLESTFRAPGGANFNQIKDIIEQAGEYVLLFRIFGV